MATKKTIRKSEPRARAKTRRRGAPDLERRLAQVERGALRRGFTTSRDAMAAMIVVRAIERATELAKEEGSTALRRALAASQKPLADFIARQRRSLGKRRRKA